MRPESILCVDDDPNIRTVMERVLGDEGHSCATAADAEEARRLLEREDYSVVLCDVGLPGASGLDLLAELGNRVATVMMTGRDDRRTAELALDLGAYGYLTKPFATNDLLASIDSAARRHRSDAARAAELEHAYIETVARFARTVELHDTATGAHVERVAAVAHDVASELGLDEAFRERLRLAAPLHDVGKIAVGDAILHKAGALTVEERHEMERHTDVGHILLTGSGNELLELAATIAWTHHECWDGSGYPRGLSAGDIPLAGRIVAVADVFDALLSDRPYRRSWREGDALAYIRGESGRRFDPDVVDALDRVRYRESGGAS